MFKNIHVFVLTLLISCNVYAVEYDVQDIGTLQTKESRPIAINNKGQILGWYDIDVSKDGRHYFLRDQNGDFHEIVEDKSITHSNVPQQYQFMRVDWRYLTNDGQVYGTFTLPNENPILFVWNKYNGVVKLGKMPGKEISAINDLGQVLIQYVESYDQNGKLIRQPAIWKNGVITTLKGLEGNIGIESDDSHGFDINNKGEVVGCSRVYLSYKNTLYQQVHAVKWVNGEAIDLHKAVPKSTYTTANTINDLGDIAVSGYLIRADGSVISHYMYSTSKAMGTKYFISQDYNHNFIDRNGKQENVNSYTNKTFSDYDSIWMHLNLLVDINDNGEMVCLGTTVYGELHIILLTPIKQT